MELVEDGPRDEAAPSDGGDGGALASWLREVVKPYRTREVMGAVLLDSDRHVLGYTLPYRGTSARCLAEPREIMAAALLAHASGMVIFHNHDSRSVEPSPQDITVTWRFRFACEVLGITLVDHVIVGWGLQYTSLRHRYPLIFVTPLDLGRLYAGDGRKVVRPKYLDPVTGQTWSGRGSKARWLKEREAAGEDIELYRVGEK